jgi:hypothetical protein
LSDASAAAQHLSPRSFLAGVGAKLLGIQLFSPIRERVKIAQKTVKDSPADKLYDAFINILCGAGGMVEVNKRVGSDEGLQRAFGRERCAEQSVIQATLDASDAENVEQMEAAVDEIYQQHSQGYRHDYDNQLQILDIDMSANLAGQKRPLRPKDTLPGVETHWLCAADARCLHHYRTAFL